MFKQEVFKKYLNNLFFFFLELKECHHGSIFRQAKDGEA